MQTAILVVVDVTVVQGALTFFTPRPTLLLQGILLTLLLGLTLAAVTAGEIVIVWGIGLWTVLLFGAYLLALYLSHRDQGNERWQPDRPVEEILEETAAREEGEDRYANWSLHRLILFISGRDTRDPSHWHDLGSCWRGTNGKKRTLGNRSKPDLIYDCSL